MEENSPKAEKKPFSEAKPQAKGPERRECACQKAPKADTEECECAPKAGEKDLKMKELTETLQRLQAEFENFQKRSAKQSAEFAQVANASLMEQLLPVLDSLESGMKHNKEFAHIHEQLGSVLKKNGLQKMELKEGMPFDHDRMDCLMQECSERLKEGEVAKILLAGYALNGKVLRHAKVSVAKSPAQHEEKTKGAEEKK